MTTNQRMIVRYTDGTTMEFIAKNISDGLAVAKAGGIIESWNNVVTKEPVTTMAPER